MGALVSNSCCHLPPPLLLRFFCSPSLLPIRFRFSLFPKPCSFALATIPFPSPPTLASSMDRTFPPNTRAADGGSRLVSSFSALSLPNASGGRSRRGTDTRKDEERSRGRRGGGGGGGGGSALDKIDALGRLMTRILRHMAVELKLNMRDDGYVEARELLKLNMRTNANIPLREHTVDDVKEAVRADNKQRFSLLEDNGELLIRANQGHSVQIVKTESLLKPILSAEEVPVCVHGTYKRNLESILESGLKRMGRLHVHFSCGLPTSKEVISGMRQKVDVLIFLNVQKALEDGMKLYISDNKVILTEGFDGVVPVKYFAQIESWPSRELILF